MYNSQNLRIRTFTRFFFQVFKQKERGTRETRYPSGPIRDFKVEIIFLKSPLDFFNFIDLQPRYRTSRISHPFNFKIPVITVF